MYISSKRSHQVAEQLRWIAVVILAALFALALAVKAAGIVAEIDSPKPVFVTSPANGVFQAGEYPGAPPFVQVGSRVEPETVVGTVWSIADVGPRRPPSTVRAGIHGTIVSVQVVDGEMVTIGQPLFELLAMTPENEVK